MSREQVESVVRRLFAAHTRHDPALLARLFAADYVNHTGPGGDGSAEARRRQIAGFIASAPDLDSRIEELMVVGDTGIARWTTTGTITGAPVPTPFGQIEARGQKVRLSGVNIVRTQGGQIVEEWIFWDELGWLRQIGALPKTAG